MYKILFSKQLTKKDHIRIISSLLLFTNTTAILLYAFLRLLFIETPITLAEDAIGLLKTLSVGTASALGIYALLLLTELAEMLINRRKFNVYAYLRYATIAVFGILMFYLAGCNAQYHAGIHKDVNTGMVTSYENLEPGNTLLVMNNEVLNHTDIPLGENFILINDDVKGLTEKNGKVSAGCKLVITDKNGREILSEPDLFKGDDVFLKENAKSLKCTISTGKPMDWEEKYDVAVTFWDKYGNGKIENKFKVRMIDIP
ncbi:MAG: hypothetical protein JST81_07770 [Bacteroidetes bacterium]|nr:hypothetical protein [Bacteroidota bacterium]